MSSETTAQPSAMATQPIPTTTITTITVDSPLPSAIITTPRLLIRPLHPQDASTMELHASPASVARHMSLAFPHPYTITHAETWISLNLTSPYNNFAICELTAPHIPIGGIGLKQGSDVNAHTAEVGYWIGEPFTGKGYMTEALEALTAWTFTERGDTVRRLCASVFGGHTASMRCLEKCGYKAEGVLKGHVEKHGEVMDLHVFGLTKGDWEERRRRLEEGEGGS